MKLKAAIIGFGRMGRFYLKELQKHPLYDVKYICDINPDCLTLASQLSPDTITTPQADIIFTDKEVDVVVLSAYAYGRMERIKQCIVAGKHIIAEKPLSDTVEDEWKAVNLADKGSVYSTVNLYLRNSWYHRTIKHFIKSGEIGELAIIRICHMTPGLAPGEGHEAEGPCFHDCGMHYVDIARWYAESEYATWHSQGIRMWSYKDPWWLQCHGTFQNGVVFDITQGFVYGQMAKDQTHNAYVDIIGTKGICHMTHDFHTATVDLRGVSRTEHIERDFGGKNIDVLIDAMAQSILLGQRNETMPQFRDAAIGSEYAWKFLHDAFEHTLPAIGTEQELEEIRQRRASMTDGYGLLPRNMKKKDV